MEFEPSRFSSLMIYRMWVLRYHVFTHITGNREKDRKKPDQTKIVATLPTEEDAMKWGDKLLEFSDWGNPNWTISESGHKVKHVVYSTWDGARWFSIQREWRTEEEYVIPQDRSMAFTFIVE